MLLGTPIERQADGLAGLVVLDGRLEVGRGRDGRRADLHDHVFLPKSGLGGRASLDDRKDDRPGRRREAVLAAQLWGHTLDVDAYVAGCLGRGSPLFEGGQQRLDLGRRDGEADVLRVGPIAGGAGDGRVHPDHLALGVDKRAARVTGVDGCVGLEEVRERFGAGSGVPRRDRAAGGRDDALGHRRRSLGKTERVADGDDCVADDRLVGVAERHRLQVRGPADVQEGDVICLVRADERGLVR